MSTGRQRAGGRPERAQGRPGDVGRGPARPAAAVAAAAVAVAVVAGLVVALAPPPAAAADVASVIGSAVETASPAVASSEPGRTDVFVRAADGRVRAYAKVPGGWWTRGVDLGGPVASQPAATSDGPGRLDLVARFADGSVRWRSLRSGTWSPWTSLGGVTAGAPAIAASGSGRLEVVAVSPSGSVYHRSRPTGTTWSAWRRIGGGATSSPALVSWGPGRVDVFTRGTSGDLVHAWRTTATAAWSGWESLGGLVTSQPAAASPASRQLDVVVRGGGGGEAFYVKRWTGTAWTSYQKLAGLFSSGPGAARDGGAVVLAGRSLRGILMDARRPAVGATWTAWAIVDGLAPFRRLGTWVDVFDYGTLDPTTAVADMRARGVRTLYLATARFTDSADFHDPVEAGRWLDAAHAAGLKVVGWYLPAYGDMPRDLRRTLAIAAFRSPGGQRFDAIGVDIERLDEVSLAAFRTRLVDHLSAVRAGTLVHVGAIVPSPFATDPGNRWEGFPWAAAGAHSDVVVPMILWSFRSGLTADGVFAYVRDQTLQARSRSGRPVHVEGGVAGEGVTPVTPDRVAAFVDAVGAAGAIGGSHYDYRTTDPALWPILRDLNAL